MSETKTNTRSRSYVFTYNNPEAFDYKAVDCKYLIVGDEIGENKTPHHQGYIMFKNQKLFSIVKTILPRGCHIEIAQGNPQQNITYCSKQKILCEYGDRPKMGRRTDLEAMREAIIEGKGMRHVVRHSDSYQSMRAAEMILKYTEVKRTWKPEVKWYWGPTGTGKTKRAFDEMKDPWISGKCLQWWQGYDAHEEVIIDDFRGDFCTFHELLRILDRYPYTIENKGGSRQLLAKKIIITSHKPPHLIYETREDIQQLLRRIDSIELME